MTFRYTGLKPNLTAGEINRWNDAANASLNGYALGEGRDTVSPQSTWVLIKNTTGVTVSRFQTLSLGTEVFPLETDGSVDLIFEAVTADPGEQACILLDTIGDDEIGRAVIHGLAYALVEGGTGSYAEPAATNKLTPASSGSIKLLTAAGGAEKLCAVLLGVSSEGSSTYLFTLDSAMPGATATIRDMADTADVATGQSVVSTLSFFDDLPSGARGICVEQDGTYYAIGPYVTSVRYNDPNLEQTKDGGTTYTNIDTAEDC